MVVKIVKATKEQLSIIDSKSKTIIVQSGAGTGKTTTMIEYICNKIKLKEGVPNDFCITAFTNSDVNNFKNKLEKKSISTQPDEDEGFDNFVTVNTMHSLTDKLISKLKDVLKIDIQKDSGEIDFFYDLAETLNKTNKGKKIINYFLSNVCEYTIAESEKPTYFFRKMADFNARNTGKEIRHKLNEYQVAFFKETLNKSIPVYIEYKLKNKEEILYTVECCFNVFNCLINKSEFSENELKSYIPTIFPYKYWLIDEIQDYSKQQFLTVLLLVNNILDITLLGVGDVAQCIYGWRNASGKNFDIFIKKLKEKREVEIKQLTTNFRTGHKNLLLPNYLLRQNILNKKQEKMIQLNSDIEPYIEYEDFNFIFKDNQLKKQCFEKTNTVFLSPCDLATNPFGNTCSIIKWLIVSKHVNPKDICILVKSNNLISKFAIDCTDDIIKFGRDGLFSKKDFINHQCKVIIKMLHYRKYTIGEESEVKNFIKNITLFESQLIQLISSFIKNRYILETPQGEDFYKEKVMEIKEIMEDIVELFSVLKNNCESFSLEKRFISTLNKCMHSINEFYSYAKKEDSINVRTLADAKGEEWDYVFILDDKFDSQGNKLFFLDKENNLSNQKFKSVCDQQNTKYVALTRAKKITFIQPNIEFVNRILSKKDSKYVKYINKYLKENKNQHLSYDELLLNGFFINKKNKVFFLETTQKKQKIKEYSYYPLSQIFKPMNKGVTELTSKSLYSNSCFIPQEELLKNKVKIDKETKLNCKFHYISLHDIKDMCVVLYNADYSKLGIHIEELCNEILLNNHLSINLSKEKVLEKIKIFSIKMDKNPIERANHTLYKIIYLCLDSMLFKVNIKEKGYVLPNAKTLLKNTKKGKNIAFGEIDFATNDRIIDLKCTNTFKQSHVLQILIYWRMGCHSENKQLFENMSMLQLIYPLFNQSFIIKTDKISKKLIDYIDKDIIGY